MGKLLKLLRVLLYKQNILEGFPWRVCGCIHVICTCLYLYIYIYIYKNSQLQIYMTLTRFGIKILKQGYNILPVYIVTKNFRKKNFKSKTYICKIKPSRSFESSYCPQRFTKRFVNGCLCGFTSHSLHFLRKNNSW